MQKKIYKKHFEYKGQMINYWNKIKNNTNLQWVTCGLSAKEGYVLEYCYR